MRPAREERRTHSASERGTRTRVRDSQAELGPVPRFPRPPPLSLRPSTRSRSDCSLSCFASCSSTLASPLSLSLRTRRTQVRLSSTSLSPSSRLADASFPRRRLLTLAARSARHGQRELYARGQRPHVHHGRERRDGGADLCVALLPALPTFSSTLISLARPQTTTATWPGSSSPSRLSSRWHQVRRTSCYDPSRWRASPSLRGTLLTLQR